MEDKKAIKYIDGLNKVNKLNKTSMMLLIIAYVFIVVLLGVFLRKNANYVVVPNYQKCFGGEQEVNPETLVVTKTIATNSDEDKKYTNSHYVYSIIDTKGEKTFSNSLYSLSLLTNNGNMVYFNQLGSKLNGDLKKLNLPSSKTRLQYGSNTSKSNYNSESNKLLQTEGIKKLFISTTYKNSNNELKNLNFYQDYITLSKSDIKSAVETNELAYLFDLNFSFYQKGTDGLYYYYKFELITKDKKSNYQIDFQSYIELEDSTLFPLLGLYNYSDDDSNFTNIGYPSGSENYIKNDLKVKNIYVKINYYTSLGQINNTKKAKTVVLVFNYDKKINEYLNQN